MQYLSLIKNYIPWNRIDNSMAVVPYRPENRDSSYLQINVDISGRIKTIAKESLAFLTYTIRYFSPVKPIIADPTSEQTIPVLFIHGYFHNSSCWSYHIPELQKNGFSNLYAVDLPLPYFNPSLSDCSIDETYSHLVENAVNSISQQTGHKKIILVGHSMGTLVSLDYAANHADKNGIEVVKVVGLGGPVNGTYMSTVALGKCARQMQYHSEFITKLHESCERKKLNVTLAGSDADVIIVPRRSAVENRHGWRFRIFETMGHLNYCRSERINRFIAEEIGPFVRENSESIEEILEGWEALPEDNDTEAILDGWVLTPKDE